MRNTPCFWEKIPVHLLQKCYLFNESSDAHANVEEGVTCVLMSDGFSGHLPQGAEERVKKSSDK